MQGSVKTVTLDEKRYDIRKMTPYKAGYIWQLLMRAAFKASQDAAKSSGVEEPPEQQQAPVEERLRGFCAMAFMYMDFDSFQFMQNECMQVISRWESLAGQPEVPIPIMVEPGKWAAKEVAEDPLLVTRLTIEAIGHNCAGFLGEPRTQQQK